MKQSILVFKRGATMNELREAIVVESEVAAAVRELGYDTEKQNLAIEDRGLCRYIVHFGKRYVGIWDSRRHTFVD